MTRDFLISKLDSRYKTKAIDLDKYRLGNMKIDEISSSEQTINLRENNAIVYAITDMKGTFSNPLFDEKHHILKVCKIINSSSKIIAGSNLQL